MKTIKLIPIKCLKPHEKTDRCNLSAVKKKIMATGYFTEPIIVDRHHLIILDGHHRVAILKKLGYQKIPAYLVDYLNKNIKVISRRKNLPIKKETIIYNSLLGKLLPYKTSKHLIPNRPKNLNINLTKLL